MASAEILEQELTLDPLVTQVNKVVQFIFIGSLRKGILSKFTYIVSPLLHFQMSLRRAKKSCLKKVTLKSDFAPCKDCAEGLSGHLLEINYASTIL